MEKYGVVASEQEKEAQAKAQVAAEKIATQTPQTFDAMVKAFEEAQKKLTAKKGEK